MFVAQTQLVNLLKGDYKGLFALNATELWDKFSAGNIESSVFVSASDIPMVGAIQPNKASLERMELNIVVKRFVQQFSESIEVDLVPENAANQVGNDKLFFLG